MSKFCYHCGNALQDEAKFCPECGTPCAEDEAPQAQPQPVPPYAQQPVQGYAQQPIQQQAPGAQMVPREGAVVPYAQRAGQLYVQPASPYSGAPQNGYYNGYPAPKKSRKGLIITLSIIGAVLIAGIVLLIVLNPFGGGSGSPDDVIDMIIKEAYSMNGSSDKLKDIVFEYKYAATDDYRKEMSDKIDGMMMTESVNEYYEEQYGKDYKVTFRIVSSEPVEDKTEYFVKDSYVDYSSVEEVREVKFKFIVTGSEDNSEYDNTVYFAKAGGKWYYMMYY